MAKSNPFVKGLSQTDLATLRRKAPYVDQVYDPNTNAVNYDLVLQRLQDTTKKISAPEEVFLNQVKRNLQREYWRQGVLLAYHGFPRAPVGYLGNNWAFHDELRRAASRISKFVPGDIANPAEGFDNWAATQNLPISPITIESPMLQFMPENANRYKKDIAGKGGRGMHSVMGLIPFAEGPRPHYYGEDYYYYQPILRAKEAGRPLRDWKNITPQETHQNRATLERYFNAINEGLANVNRRYAERKAREKQEAEENKVRAIRAEAALESYKRKERFDAEEFKRALAAKDLAYDAETKKREAAHALENEQRRKEFEKWKLDFQSESQKRVEQEREIARVKGEEQAAKYAKETLEWRERVSGLQKQMETATQQAKEQADRHIIEMSNLRGERLAQAQELANAKVENERIKSQNALLLKNSVQRRIQMRNMGSMNMHFVGMGQRDFQGLAAARVLAGRNKFVRPEMSYNSSGLLVPNKNAKDTGVPDLFLSMLTSQTTVRKPK